MKSHQTVRVILFAFSIFVSVLHAENWPQWRGPTGQGIATTHVPLQWSETENIAWKTRIPGRGWSSPVIWDDQIWVTTAETVAATDEEKAKRKKTITNTQPVEIVQQVKLYAICIDKNTGRLKHNIQVLTDNEPDPIHKENSYATPSPVIELGRIYCHFGTHGTACVNTETGEVIWTNQEIRLNHENGPGSTPVLFENRLIFHCDGSDDQSIAALDTSSGQIAWRVKRSGQMHREPQMQKSYATPLIVEINGKAQVVSPAADWVYGYDPKTGTELWKIPYGELGFSNSARPVAADGMIYVSTGFMKSKLIAVRHGGEELPKDVLWDYQKQVPNVSSPVVVDGLVFFMSDQGVATCLDATTGDLFWTKRIGGNHWSSPTYADGHLLFSDKSGLTTMLRASKEFSLVAANQLDGVIMASAAAADGALFIRTDNALYRIEE